MYIQRVMLYVSRCRHCVVQRKQRTKYKAVKVHLFSRSRQKRWQQIFKCLSLNSLNKWIVVVVVWAPFFPQRSRQCSPSPSTAESPPLQPGFLSRGWILCFDRASRRQMIHVAIGSTAEMMWLRAITISLSPSRSISLPDPTLSTSEPAVEPGNASVAEMIRFSIWPMKWKS